MAAHGSPKRFWMNSPPWLLIGAAVVLLPIVAFMTLSNIHREKELTTRLMMEKGAALINPTFFLRQGSTSDNAMSFCSV